MLRELLNLASWEISRTGLSESAIFSDSSSFLFKPNSTNLNTPTNGMCAQLLKQRERILMLLLVAKPKRPQPFQKHPPKAGGWEKSMKYGEHGQILWGC